MATGGLSGEVVFERKMCTKDRNMLVYQPVVAQHQANLGRLDAGRNENVRGGSIAIRINSCCMSVQKPDNCSCPLVLFVPTDRLWVNTRTCKVPQPLPLFQGYGPSVSSAVHERLDTVVVTCLLQSSTERYLRPKR